MQITIKLNVKNVFEADEKEAALKTLSKLNASDLTKIAKLSKNESALSFLADDALINSL